MVERETDKGTIRISNNVFASIIGGAIEEQELSDKIWPATRRGRQINMAGMLSESEFAGSISSEEIREGEMVLEFNVIVRFGISIRATAKRLCDRIAEDISEYLGTKPKEITVNIVGVVSKQKARRSTKVVFRYDR